MSLYAYTTYYMYMYIVYITTHMHTCTHTHTYTHNMHTHMHAHEHTVDSRLLCLQSLVFIHISEFLPPLVFLLNLIVLKLLPPLAIYILQNTTLLHNNTFYTMSCKIYVHVHVYTNHTLTGTYMYMYMYIHVYILYLSYMPIQNYTAYTCVHVP